jgi:hypothetical protein
MEKDENDYRGGRKEGEEKKQTGENGPFDR